MYISKKLRLPGFDYSQPARYFLTFCTKNRKPRFGEIVAGTMQLNPLGKFVADGWNLIPQRFPNFVLGKFVVMPDHFHAILANVGEEQAAVGQANVVSDGHARHQLSQIVGSFKSAVSKWAHENGFSDFRWQKSFYDHIIRSFESIEGISEYIRKNPSAPGVNYAEK